MIKLVVFFYEKDGKYHNVCVSDKKLKLITIINKSIYISYWHIISAIMNQVHIYVFLMYIDIFFWKFFILKSNLYIYMSYWGRNLNIKFFKLKDLKNPWPLKKRFIASLNGVNKSFFANRSRSTMTSCQSKAKAHQTGGGLIVMSRRVGPAQPRVKEARIELSYLEPRGFEER